MTNLPATETLETRLDRGWLTIALNRPQARNALSQEMTEELTSVLDAVRDDRSVRGISLRGNGKVFCAGGDLKGFQAIFQGEMNDPAEVAAESEKIGRLFAALDAMPQVVVMLVHGAAMAGGLGMVCAGDVVAVTRDAKFALTETTLGIPPAQIAPFVLRRLGLKIARRLMLTAARFSGEEARTIGLADYVVDDQAGLDAIEDQVRADVMGCAPSANAVTKQIVLAATNLDRDAIIAMAGRGFAECMLSEEGREGIAAFMQKRKPAWADPK